ncbi:soluble quino protein glucose dehydrogenase [Exidia glandulosa HHB12029]|uniref:Soluble quino protein glucose dehydrogenase n=1 Tax=Exidia glandulosa HHB12029 TaxID=1314781 RepID=A0A165I9P2_EXIGL|nr:soluble quino protein glucose dehydrogenase [Exidia glandulosa HHB12029]
MKLTVAFLVAALALGDLSTFLSSPSRIPILTSDVSTASAAFITPKESLKVASGWKVQGVASGLHNPRSILFDSAGHLLVVEKSKGLTAFTLNSNGSVKSTKTLLSYKYLNHGLTFSTDGKTLFASSENSAWSWKYNPTSMTLSSQKTIVTGMDNGHVTRTLLVSKKHPNLLIVSRGSLGNLDASASSAHASVKVFDWKKVGSKAYDYVKNGKVLAYGVRNEVGIMEDKAGRVYGVENSADNLVRVENGQTTDVHLDNPGEKLNFFGDANSISGNRWYGYPTCFSVWNPTSFPSGDDFKTGDWFVQEPNSTINDAFCQSKAVKPKLLFQAHSAPLDIKLGNDDAAYVSFHGSWDRKPPTGYKVVAIPGSVSSSGAWTPKANVSSKSGYTDIMYAPDLTKCPDACFRPTGLVWNKAGTRLYVSSDATGEIVVLSRT